MNQALIENKIALKFKEGNPQWSWFTCQQEARKVMKLFKECIK